MRTVAPFRIVWADEAELWASWIAAVVESNAPVSRVAADAYATWATWYSWLIPEVSRPALSALSNFRMTATSASRAFP